MSSRKDHLTRKLIAVAKKGFFEAIQPLVDTGADVNGSLFTPLECIIDEIDRSYLTHHYKLDYMLTFHELFECGADIDCLRYTYRNFVEVIYKALGMQGIVLLMQYDAANVVSELPLNRDYKLSIHCAMCYHGYRGGTYYTDSILLCSITPGLLKDYLVQCDGRERRFLEFAQDRERMLVVEFSFSIDFVIGLFC